MKKLSNSEENTTQIAIELAQKLKAEPKSFIVLKGILGAGKTTFARAFIKEFLGKSIQVTSPTFNIAKTYEQKLAHLDLYRVQNKDELDQLGFETYFYDYQCCMVEWLDQIENYQYLLPNQYTFIEINILDQNKREIIIQDLKKV